MTSDLTWMVLIPAYNEASTILPLVQAVLAYHPNELVVVNDASTDNTAALLQDQPITLLNQPCNQGKAAGLWLGFDLAIAQNMDIVITMDGDGQHLPRDLPALLKQYQQQPNSLVLGARQRNPEIQPYARYAANRLANFWISWAAGCAVADSQSGYRVYPVTALKTMGRLKHSAGFVLESEILVEAAWQGYPLTHIPIEAIYAEDRRASHFHPMRDIAKITRMVMRRLWHKRFNLKGLWRVLFRA